MNYADVKNSAQVVLVEFYASWCPHCQKMMPIVEQVKELMDGQVPVYQFDIDENRDLAELEGVESIPTFLLYRDGKLVWNYTGEIDGNTLLAQIQSFL